MSENKFVTAVHEKTGVVSAIPKHYLTAFPVYREVSEDEIIELRRASEFKTFGEYLTPAPKPKAVTKPSVAPVVKEGGK
jgi:hypothetical protein